MLKKKQILYICGNTFLSISKVTFKTYLVLQNLNKKIEILFAGIILDKGRCIKEMWSQFLSNTNNIVSRSDFYFYFIIGAYMKDEIKKNMQKDCRNLRSEIIRSVIIGLL